MIAKNKSLLGSLDRVATETYKSCDHNILAASRLVTLRSVDTKSAAALRRALFFGLGRDWLIFGFGEMSRPY